MHIMCCKSLAPKRFSNLLSTYNFILFWDTYNYSTNIHFETTVNILKIGTPKIITVIVLKS